MAKFCPNCGKEVNEAKFCPNCGAQLKGEGEEQKQESNPIQEQGTEQPPSKKKKNGCLVSFGVLFIICVIVTIIGIITQPASQDNSNAAEGQPADVAQSKAVINVSEFSRITPEELKAKLGEPESTEEWESETVVGTFPTTTFVYDKGSKDFSIIDGKVVEMNLFSSETQQFQYTTEQSIFELFGISPSSEMVKTADTGLALKFQNVSDKVDKIWISSMDSEKKTIDVIKIVFDNSYYDDTILMSIAEKTNFQIQSQELVKEILKAPSTAKFPNILNWAFKKTKDSVVVQSYVDAQNSFGAAIRSNFQITFDLNNLTVSSVIFDGEELIKQTDTKSGSAKDNTETTTAEQNSSASEAADKQSVEADVPASQKEPEKPEEIPQAASTSPVEQPAPQETPPQEKPQQSNGSIGEERVVYFHDVNPVEPTNRYALADFALEYSQDENKDDAQDIDLDGVE